VEWKTKGTRIYQALAARSRESMEECEALSAVPANRSSVEWTGEFPLLGEV
jgi:hypothetical protein